MCVKFFPGMFRGANEVEKRSLLKGFIKSLHVDLVFLQETKFKTTSTGW